MSKGLRKSQITTIPIDQINVMNPRVRNKKIFYEITENIAQVGLKRPITVKRSSSSGRAYDLICGQGRLEAFVACGHPFDMDVLHLSLLKIILYGIWCVRTLFHPR